MIIRQFLITLLATEIVEIIQIATDTYVLVVILVLVIEDFLAIRAVKMIMIVINFLNVQFALVENVLTKLPHAEDLANPAMIAPMISAHFASGLVFAFLVKLVVNLVTLTQIVTDWVGVEVVSITSAVLHAINLVNMIHNALHHVLRALREFVDLSLLFQLQ